VLAKARHPPDSDPVLEDQFFAAVGVAGAEISLAADALGAERGGAAGDSARAGGVPLERPFLVLEVANKVQAFGSTDLASANLLLVLEDNAVTAAERPATVLTQPGGLLSAGAEEAAFELAGLVREINHPVTFAPSGAAVNSPVFARSECDEAISQFPMGLGSSHRSNRCQTRP